MSRPDPLREMVRMNGPLDGETCTIRAPRSEDYQAISELAGQLGYSSAEDQIRSRLGMMNDQDHAVFVAELATGQIAGWVGMHVFRCVEIDHATFISGLIIDESLRSRKIGMQLLKTADEWAQLRDCKTICVSSNVIRSQAHRFYLRNGYRNVKTQTVFLKDLDGPAPCDKLL